VRDPDRNVRNPGGLADRVLPVTGPNLGIAVTSPKPGIGLRRAHPAITVTVQKPGIGLRRARPSAPRPAPKTVLPAAFTRHRQRRRVPPAAAETTVAIHSAVAGRE